MRIALTGGTGFVGRYVIRRLVSDGHDLVCWHRETSDRTGLEDAQDHLEWVPGELGDAATAAKLVEGCDAVVHAGLYRVAEGFQGAVFDVATYAERNIVGSLQLIQAARRAQVPRFVFISTCAVHDVILEDRPLDEAHPLWPKSHYGAYKAAVEKFVHSFGLGEGYDICSLRPTGIYGVAHPPSESKWYELVQAIAADEPIVAEGGGKEVHVADVAEAVALLLEADDIAGQCYNCTDLYVSQWDVAHLAREIVGSEGAIRGSRTRPKHTIETGKIEALGMAFGGRPLLEETVEKLLLV